MRLSAPGAAEEFSGQLPAWLLPAAALASACLLLAVCLLLWYCCCWRRKSAEAAPGSPSLPPLAPPSLLQQTVQPAPSLSPLVPGGVGVGVGCGQQSALVQRHAKGLLGSRRGSSASLTISLSPSCEGLGASSALAERQQERELLKSLSRPLSPSELGRACDDPQSLFKEFWTVPMHHASRRELPEGAAPKNRYPTIVPNADTRVSIRGEEYINANYLRGPLRQQRGFIATQGPIAETVEDFWQMVWEQRAAGVVMLTDLVERARCKCDLYFPLHPGDRMQHARLHCELLQLSEHPPGAASTASGYQLRLLRLTHSEQPGLQHTLQHFWFRSWPDHLSPESSCSLLDLAERTLLLDSPVVVHCSAGLGRTGAFCALCICIRQLQTGGSCDCLQTMCQLRLDRGGMIQSHEQYEFVHRALRRYADTRLQS